MDALLLSTLNRLSDAVDDLRKEQSTMKEELHDSILDNTRRIAAVEKHVTEAKAEVKKEARKWGAIGGAATSAGAIAAATIKWLLAVPHKG